MEVFVDLLGELGANARHGGQLLGAGIADIVDGAKGGQQLLLAVLAQAGNFRQARSPHSVRALLAVKADGKAVGFVAQAA